MTSQNIHPPFACAFATKLRRNQYRAFTLLELLLALAVVAILATSLFASLSVAFKARKASEDVIDSSQRAAVAMDIIKTDLENAIPPNPLSNPSTSTNTTALYLAGVFNGTTSQNGNFRADDLTFYTVTDGPAHSAGDCDVKGIELTLAVPADPRMGTDPVLLRRVTSNILAPQGQQATVDEEVICRGVLGFSLRYFDGATWNDTWNSTTNTPSGNTSAQNSLPQAVEVTLDLQSSPDHPDRQTHYRRVFMISTFPQSNATDSGMPDLPMMGG